ncbi:hypothetical protein BT96DRAFT_1026391 [Gymnopus androsaceus JB14]|uniref:Uncharacterized protein n=1 Tax=Gymnopus androsaceus JB14 TaxID=1447944 RepID=A0A6A4GKV8_9AGAR|nr:hypothetical protein BT96DRAFT_1026391 [Gymnopus androsaceus JB14]
MSMEVVPTISMFAHLPLPLHSRTQQIILFNLFLHCQPLLYPLIVPSPLSCKPQAAVAIDLLYYCLVAMSIILALCIGCRYYNALELFPAHALCACCHLIAATVCNA